MRQYAAPLTRRVAEGRGLTGGTPGHGPLRRRHDPRARRVNSLMTGGTSPAARTVGPVRPVAPAVRGRPGTASPVMPVRTPLPSGKRSAGKRVRMPLPQPRLHRIRQMPTVYPPGSPPQPPARAFFTFRPARTPVVRPVPAGPPAAHGGSAPPHQRRARPVRWGRGGAGAAGAAGIPGDGGLPRRRDRHVPHRSDPAHAPLPSPPPAARLPRNPCVMRQPRADTASYGTPVGARGIHSNR